MRDEIGGWCDNCIDKTIGEIPYGTIDCVALRRCELTIAPQHFRARIIIYEKGAWGAGDGRYWLVVDCDDTFQDMLCKFSGSLKSPAVSRSAFPSGPIYHVHLRPRCHFDYRGEHCSGVYLLVKELSAGSCPVKQSACSSVCRQWSRYKSAMATSDPYIYRCSCAVYLNSNRD